MEPNAEESTERAPTSRKRERGSEVTRIAPSPTGALHLGNARTFLINWAIARAGGWRIVLRIEDLDTPRVKPGTIEETVRTLEWLGIDWDEGPAIQSADLGPYEAAVAGLAARGLAYPCDLSRREIELASSAPNEPGITDLEGREQGESVFPAHLRPVCVARSFDDRETNWRFVTPTGVVTFDDAFTGPQRLEPARTIGDFVIWTKRATPSYQLAVVVDDARQRVTQVVRGDDLLDSAARQILLYGALGLAPEPTYTHLPLVRGADGRRLAKRHGDTRLTSYRAAGVPAERIIGLCAGWSGIGDDARSPMSAEEFLHAFDLRTMPRQDVVFTPEDEAWLTG